MEVINQSIGSHNSLYVNAAPGVSGPNIQPAVVGTTASLPAAQIFAGLSRDQLYVIAGGSFVLLILLLRK